MSDELDADQITTAIETAVRLNQFGDYQGAYDLAFPLTESGQLSGSQLAHAQLVVGIACTGLHSYDTAMYYVEQAAANGSGDVRTEAESYLAQLNHLNAAEGLEVDGVDGEQEAEAMIVAGEEALRRGDYETGWEYLSHAYDGLRLSKPQLSRAAIGIAACYLNSGDLDQVEGYLQVAESQDASALTARITELREFVALRQAGSTIGDDGVDRTELGEINDAARAAAFNGDYDTAYQLLMQLYESPALPPADKGRIANNLGLMCLHLQSYDDAHQFFTEAASIGRAETQERANRLLQQLADRDRAQEIVASLNTAEELEDL